MKKTIGIILMLAAFPVMGLSATDPADDHAFLIEVVCKLAAIIMLAIGAWMADMFDKDTEEKKSEVRLAHDDGDFKMPEE